MTKLKMLFIVLLGSALFTSCLEKEDDEKVNPSWQSLIADNSQKAWVMTANTTNGEDSFAQLMDCEMDNQYVFYSTGNLEITEGESSCQEGSEYLMSSHSWSVSEESRQLFWDDDFYTVQSITADKMVLVFNGADFEVVATLEAVEGN